MISSISYDPAVGRFLSEDPLGFESGDVNFYAYVGNNPVNANDPSGLIDIIYTAGSAKPTIQNQSTPGLNYFARNGANSQLYPMGSGAIERVQSGKLFTSVVGPQFTQGIINWGTSHILNNRLPGASGSASLYEVYVQSGEGKPWDTKHSLSINNLYVVNGKAELRDYVGNAIWGAGMNALGISEITARVGAHAQSISAYRKLDDPRDQEAISFGFSLRLNGGSGSLGNSANGGFVIYPNKANTNTLRSAYSK